MGKRIAFVGAGALGGYVGGHLTRAGHDVMLIDPWPEHVEAMRRDGLQLSGLTAAGRHVHPREDERGRETGGTGRGEALPRADRRLVKYIRRRIP